MDLLGTDLTKVAGAYSAFAGVLAGFVFVVIGILLSNRPPEEQANAHNVTLSWSVVAFVGLSMSCFLFALISGEDRFVSATTQPHPELTRIRPLVLMIIASAVFILAVLVLFLVLIWLFKEWLFKRQATNDAVIKQLRVVIWFLGLMVVFFFDGTFVSVAIALGQSASDDVPSLEATLAIGMLALAIGEALGALLRKVSPGEAGKGRQVVRVVTQYVFFFAIFGGAFLFNLVDFADEMGSSAWHVNDREYVWVIVFAAVVALCILNLPEWRTGTSTLEPDTTDQRHLTPAPAMLHNMSDAR